MSAKILSAVLTKRASRKTAMNAGTAALLGGGIGALGGAALGGAAGINASNARTPAQKLVGIQSDLPPGQGAAIGAGGGAATGAIAGLGVYGAAKLLEHLVHEHHHPKMASDYCPPGVIKAEPATNMTTTPVAKPAIATKTVMKSAGLADVLARVGRGVARATTPALAAVKPLVMPAAVAGTAALGLTDRLHPVDAVKALVAKPTAPSAIAQVVDQAKDKAQGLLSGAKDFAGGFAQNPMKWDAAHMATAGGVALGGAALLAHVLHKKRKPEVVADEQELAEA